MKYIGFLVLCLLYLSRELVLAQAEPHLPHSEVDKLIRSGHNNLMQGKPNQVAKIIQTLQKKYPQYPPQEQIAYWILSANYFDTKYLIDSALACYQRALLISNQLPADAPVNMHLHLSMGYFYLHLGIADVALASFQKVKAINQNKPLRMPGLDAYIGIVRAFLDLKQLDSAKKSALETFYVVHKIPLEMGYILSNYWLGVCYEASQNRDSAKYYFKKVENLRVKHPRDNHLKIRALEKLIKILVSDKTYQDSTEVWWTKLPDSLPELKITKHLMQAEFYFRTQRQASIKPLLDSIKIILAKEMLSPEVVRHLSIWQETFRAIFDFCRLSDNETMLTEFEQLYEELKIWEERRNTQQNFVLRKLSIYTTQYYDQQRQTRDANDRLMILLAGSSGLFLFLMLLGAWQYYRRRIENQRQDIEFKTAEAIILQYEMEEIKRNEQQLRKEIELQKADITDLALENTFKNKQAQELLGELKDLKSELQSPEKNNQSLDNLIKELRNKINANERRDMLMANIDKVNHEFYERLSQKSRELTQTEKEFCGLVRLQLSSKEIAILRNITPKAVKMMRYRLRKKLNLPSEEDLYSFIADI